jgi:hypothetical protein
MYIGFILVGEDMCEKRDVVGVGIQTGQLLDPFLLLLRQKMGMNIA